MLHRHFRLFKFKKKKLYYHIAVLQCRFSLEFDTDLIRWKLSCFFLCSTTTLLRSHLTSGEPNLKLWVWLLSYQLILVQVKANSISFCISSFLTDSKFTTCSLLRWSKSFFNKAVVFSGHWELEFTKLTVPKRYSNL